MPTFVSAGDHAGDPTTAPTCTLGATQADDIIVALVTNGGSNSDPAMGGTVVTTDGLTFSKVVSAAGSGTTMNGSLWWARATGNHTGRTVVATTVDSGSMAVFVIRDCKKTGSPFHASVATGQGTAATTSPGLTTTAPGCMLLWGLCVDDDVAPSGNWAWATAGNASKSGGPTSTGGADTGAFFGYLAQSSPAATGNMTWGNVTSDFKVAITAALLPATPTFTADFDTGDLSQWATPQETGATADVSVTTGDPVPIEGTHCGRFELRSGDERAEVYKDIALIEGDDVYIRWLTKLSAGFPAEGTWQVIWQLHQAGGGSPVLEMDVDGTGAGNFALHSGIDGLLWTGPPIDTAWHEFVVRVKHSANGAVGFVELWMDGVQQTFDDSSTTYFVETLIDDHNYPKAGYYRDTAMVGAGVVAVDDYRVGTEFFSDPPPPPPDTTAPDTTIDTGPDELTTETTATFTFSADEEDCTFEGRLDGGGWETITSPHEIASLELGAHVFEVRATDAAENTDLTPAEWAWTVTADEPPEPEPSAGNVMAGRSDDLPLLGGLLIH